MKMTARGLNAPRSADNCSCGARHAASRTRWVAWSRCRLRRRPRRTWRCGTGWPVSTRPTSMRPLPAADSQGDADAGHVSRGSRQDYPIFREAMEPSLRAVRA